MNNTDEVKFYEQKKKPLIGFEPMTYALPWRYSTTELKGPLDSIYKCVTTIADKIYLYIYFIYIYKYMQQTQKS